MIFDIFVEKDLRKAHAVVVPCDAGADSVICCCGVPWPLISILGKSPAIARRRYRHDMGLLPVKHLQQHGRRRIAGVIETSG